MLGFWSLGWVGESERHVGLSAGRTPLSRCSTGRFFCATPPHARGVCQRSAWWRSAIASPGQPTPRSHLLSCQWLRQAATGRCSVWELLGPGVVACREGSDRVDLLARVVLPLISSCLTCKLHIRAAVRPVVNRRLRSGISMHVGMLRKQRREMPSPDEFVVVGCVAQAECATPGHRSWLDL